MISECMPTRRPLFLLSALLGTLILTGCALGDSLTKDDAFVPEGWKSIAVLPVTDNPLFGRAIAEYFAFKLTKQDHFRVVAPATIEIALKRKGLLLASSGPTSADLSNIAQTIGVEAVFLGKIPTPAPALAKVEMKLIDVATGKTIAMVVRAAIDVPFVYDNRTDTHRLVTTATERAAEEMLGILEELWQRQRSAKGG